MTTVALVNASGVMDGVSYDARSFGLALRELGHRLVWYQCIDRGVEPVVRERDRTVPGFGFPHRGIDQGINRLWWFPHRLRAVTEEVLLLMDPTLVNVARFHSHCIVRVHDLKPLTPFADRRAATWMFHHALPRLRELQRVLVPSTATATDLVAHGFHRERIRVVPETHDLGEHPGHVERSLERIRATGSVRVLYVAADRPNKNIDHVLRLAESSARSASRDRLQFTLLSRLRPDRLARVAQMNLPNLTVIPEARSVAEVYEAADVLVYPSRYEGFGRPVIEAMSFGLPVLASRIPPLTEIVGEHGILLDAGEVGPWLDALDQLTEPARYETAARRSFDRGKEFSPERFRTAVSRAFADLE